MRRSVRTALATCASLIGGATPGAAQAPLAAPCASAEARQFDFWVGEWTLAGRNRRPGSEQWTETRSTNLVRSTMGGCVIEERFENQAPAPWTGMSVSVWNPATRRWQQTWADSQGGYIVLTGEWRDGRMVLMTPTRTVPAGGTATNRMVFRDIAADSLVWDWELSRDGGTTWDVLWSIVYRRR